MPAIGGQAALEKVRRDKYIKDFKGDEQFFVIHHKK